MGDDERDIEEDLEGDAHGETNQSWGELRSAIHERRVLDALEIAGDCERMIEYLHNFFWSQDKAVEILGFVTPLKEGEHEVRTSKPMTLPGKSEWQVLGRIYDEAGDLYMVTRRRFGAVITGEVLGEWLHCYRVRVEKLS